MRGGAPPCVPVLPTSAQPCLGGASNFSLSETFLVLDSLRVTHLFSCWVWCLISGRPSALALILCITGLPLCVNSLPDLTLCSIVSGSLQWLLPALERPFAFYVLLLSSSPTLPFFMPSYKASLFVTQVHVAFSPFGPHQSPGSERPVLAVGSLPCSLFHSLHSLAELYSIHCVALWLFEYLSISAVKSCLGSSTSVYLLPCAK